MSDTETHECVDIDRWQQCPECGKNLSDAARSMCGTCHGFGYIGDGPFTCGAKCHDCGGSGNVS